uniref:Uncharacterized protein n=1 Tax=Lepeophtheirus salmonis TaxID=72036 RepID=A0A0K2UWM4_LEPSM
MRVIVILKINWSIFNN